MDMNCGDLEGFGPVGTNGPPKRDPNTRTMEQILKLLEVVFGLCIQYSDQFPGEDQEIGQLMELYANVEDAFNGAHNIVHGHRFQGCETLIGQGEERLVPVRYIPHHDSPQVEVPAHQYPECEHPECKTRVFHHNTFTSKKHMVENGYGNLRHAEVCWACWFDERMLERPIKGKIGDPVPAGGA